MLSFCAKGMRLLFFTPILLFLESLIAQNLNYIHYNTNNSKLPHDIVYRIQQDKAGFLWISTDDGLVRYDGSEMENFDKGFSSKYVIGTDEENGRIWACAWKDGIYVLKGDSGIRVNCSDPGATYRTNKILVFNDLVFSYYYSQYFVMHYDSVKNLLIPYSLRSQKDSFDLLDPSLDEPFGNLLKTSAHRLYSYGKKGVYELKNKKLTLLNATIQPKHVSESPGGQLYFMSGNCIFETDPDFSSSLLFYRIPVEKFGNREPISFRILPSGNICIGFKSPELHNGHPQYYFINTRTSEIFDFTKAVIGEVLSADLMLDSEGSIWLSTDGRGIFHFFDVPYRQLGGEPMMKNSTISVMHLIGKDSLFIGTKEGLYLYRNNKIQFLRNTRHEMNYPVNLLSTSENGSIGIKNTTPFWRPYTYVNGQIREIASVVLSGTKHYRLTEHKDGSFKLQNIESKEYKGLTQPCVAIQEDEHQNLWLTDGNHLFYRENKRNERVFEHPQFGKPLINCICYEGGKGLWIGTNKGLFLISSDGSVSNWGPQEGLMNVNIRCLYVEDSNSLWIGTQNGLYNLHDHYFTVYKRRDGLVADDVLCMEPLGNKEIALGSSKGITFFLLHSPDPERIPLLQIEKFSVNNHEEDWKHPLNLSYNSHLTLKYTAITFVYPELLSYAYRLHKNDPWIFTRNTSLIFTDLKPGSYHLELKVKKYNTSFSEPVLIDFNIQGPWWSSLWFLILLFAICVALSYLLLKQQLNKQKQKAILKLELAELKMKALQAQLNPHFISNALNTIQYFILTRDEISANNYLGQFTDLTRLFLEVSRNRFINLETELHLLNNYLNLECLRFESKFHYSIDIDPRIDIRNTYIPGLIMQPFVENSVNHGIVYLPKDKMGLISISIKKSGEELNIAINDNGVGRKKAKEIKEKLKKSYRSHASQILEELRQAYNLIPGCFVNIETFDKESTEKQSLGTCVYIRIKLNTVNLN